MMRIWQQANDDENNHPQAPIDSSNCVRIVQLYLKLRQSWMKVKVDR